MGTGRMRAALTLIGSYLVFARRFVTLYWRYLLAVAGGAAGAWLSADAVSDYTRGGWELHIEQRAWGLDLHVHHWYYGLPLLALAFVLIDRRPVAAVFTFVLGQSVAAHSYYNEGGIPSIVEGGATIAVPPFVYWPLASLLVGLFTFFVVRAHEWLVLSAEREEAAQSYLLEADDAGPAIAALHAWAAGAFDRRVAGMRDGSRVGTFSTLESQARGLWELRYRATPFDDGRVLLTVRIEHFPHRHESRRLLELLSEADGALRAACRREPTLAGPLRPAA